MATQHITLNRHYAAPMNRDAQISLACFSLFVLLSALLHLLVPHMSPLSTPLSEYALTPYGWLFTLSLLLLGIGSACLVSLLSRVLAPTRTIQLGLFLLSVWSAGTVVAGIFPTDPGGIPVSLSGAIHGFSASFGFFSFVIAAILLTLNFRRHSGLRANAGISLWLALAALICLGFFALPQALWGGGERLFVGVVVLWLGHTALQLRDHI